MPQRRGRARIRPPPPTAHSSMATMRPEGHQHLLHVSVCAHVCVCMSRCMSVCMQCMCVSLGVCAYAGVSMCMCVTVCMFVCTCVSPCALCGCVHACVLCACMHMCISVSPWACVCVHMCILMKQTVRGWSLPSDLLQSPPPGPTWLALYGAEVTSRPRDTDTSVPPVLRSTSVFSRRKGDGVPASLDVWGPSR